jgi:hypothetical protein
MRSPAERRIQGSAPLGGGSQWLVQPSSSSFPLRSCLHLASEERLLARCRGFKLCPGVAAATRSLHRGTRKPHRCTLGHAASQPACPKHDGDRRRPLTEAGAEASPQSPQPSSAGGLPLLPARVGVELRLRALAVFDPMPLVGAGGIAASSEGEGGVYTCAQRSAAAVTRTTVVAAPVLCHCPYPAFHLRSQLLPVNLSCAGVVLLLNRRCLGYVVALLSCRTPHMASSRHTTHGIKQTTKRITACSNCHRQSSRTAWSALLWGFNHKASRRPALSVAQQGACGRARGRGGAAQGGIGMIR